MIPLSIQVFERGAAGIPTTQFVADLRGRADSYEHTISDRFGFESMSINMAATTDEIYGWLQNGLMRSVIVYSPDAGVVWEGYLETINATLGQKKASLSLKPMGNRVRTKWTINGVPVITTVDSNAASQSLYGVKDFVVSAGEVQLTAAAANANLRALNSSAFPRSVATTQAKTGSAGDLNLQLNFAGWYATLDWLFVPSTFDGTTTSAVETLIGSFLTSAAGTNAFVSTDTTKLIAMGYNLNNLVRSETTFRQQIEKYMGFGDSTGAPMAWGVYENRMLQTALWAGTTPSTITYREDARSGTVFDAYGNAVQPWDVRPGAMSEVVQLLDVGPVSGAVDAAARKYVARVVCSISGGNVGVSLESTGGNDLERTFAAFATRAL